MSDDYLLAKRCQKDAEVFATVYRQHVNSVYAYLMSLTGNQQDAEDLTAQTFLAALESLHKFRQDGTFEAWLIGIARHKFLDFRRKTRSEPSIESEYFDLSDTSPNIETQVEESTRWQSMLSALKQLKTERYEALTLRVFGGLSASEAAQVMNKTEGAVNNLVYRAIQDLRSWLNEQ